MESLVNTYLKEQKLLLGELCQSEGFEKSTRATLGILVSTLKSGNKLLIAGNGGSASQASHFAGELVGRFQRERRGLPVIALNADSAIITAWSNDYSFDDIFARQIEALGCPGDLFLGLSTSGNSTNIIKAVDYAKNNSIRTICLLGKDGGRLKDASDAEIIVPHQDTARIQEIHLMLIHHLSAEIENALFS